MSETFVLQHPGSCSGMFWRKDPRGVDSIQKGGNDWPRNKSLLEGHTHKNLSDDMDWLEVTRWKQAGSEEWVEDCQNLFMPFEQGGLLLHKQD
eukprot:TRINITY_DN784_c0_g1_i3.p1 TRINITY_DN784_c0_g1~~TRINITY_DN784_c0_g1_i3.p1  ORF type:complete len:93 (-),score=27.73 TRINITY_DN784_c0_g1_i3:174-452(-)